MAWHLRFPLKYTKKRSGKMNQSENTLPHEHEDLSADLQHQCKKLGTAYISNPAPWDMNRQTLLTGQQAILAKFICSKTEDPVLTYTNTHI